MVTCFVTKENRLCRLEMSVTQKGHDSGHAILIKKAGVNYRGNNSRKRESNATRRALVVDYYYP